MKSILSRIDEKLKRLNRCRPLLRGVLSQLKNDFSIEWTYNSNAIEGNTLSLVETRLVLEEGITVKGKNLREHFEATNHRKAIEFVETLAKPQYRLTEKDIFRVHKIILENIESEFAGRYRNGQVRILGAAVIPPNHLKVQKLISALIKEVICNTDKLHDVELATYLHHQFVYIHPFFDGNGRTARLLMNLLLMQKGYPPAVILHNDRKKYYAALRNADKGDRTKLSLMVAQAVERSLDIYLASIGKEDEEYVLLSELAKEFSYSQEYLSLLARRGKIDAYKESRNWFSTRKAVKDYINSLSKE